MARFGTQNDRVKILHQKYFSIFGRKKSLFSPISTIFAQVHNLAQIGPNGTEKGEKVGKNGVSLPWFGGEKESP